MKGTSGLFQTASGSRGYRKKKKKVPLSGIKIFSSMERLKNGQQDKNKDMEKVRVVPE